MQFFIVYILCLTAALGQSYSLFRHHFSGAAEYKARFEEAEEEVLRQRVQVKLAQDQLLGFRQQVAILAPEIIDQRGLETEKFALRNLASVAKGKRVGDLKVRLAQGIYEHGRRKFKERKFEEAIVYFKELTTKYPFSARAIEAQFLLVEAYFQTKEFDHCVRAVDHMVNHYPDNEMTGFALLRLAQIFEGQKRTEEAAEVYKTILQTYSQPDLSRQARRNLAGIEL